MSTVTTSAPADQYSLIHETSGGITQSLGVATYGVFPTSFNLPFNTGSTGPGSFYFDPALYSSTIKLRLLTTAIVNATAPGASCTFQPGLYAVTPNAGAAGIVSMTLGSVVTGSQASAQGPLTASTTYTFDSGDFDAPTAGTKAIGVVLAGATTAANSSVSFHVRLLARSV